MMLRRLMSLMPLSALLVQGGFSHAATLEYVSGHGDIGLAYDGELELHYHLDNATLDLNQAKFDSRFV